MEAFGFELEPEADPITREGSWFTELAYRTKRALNKTRIAKLFASMKTAIINAVHERADTEALQKRAEATKTLLEAMGPFDEAALRLGDVLIVKVKILGKTRLHVETISRELRRKLDKNPILLTKPHKLYSMITQAEAIVERSGDSEKEIRALEDEDIAPT